MKKNICLIIAFLISLLCGCNGNKNFFSNKVLIVDSDFKISNTLKGEKLAVNDIYSMLSLICFDEYLLVITPNAQNVFHVLTFEGEIISQFGTIGRANNELDNCDFNGQTEIIDGDNCIWINDVSKARLVLINIDKSIQNEKIVIINEIKTPPTSVNCFYTNDSVLIAEQLTGRNFEFLKQNILLNTFSQETLYKDDDVNAFSLYKSIWRWDSHRNRLIGAMQSVNQLNFYSIEDQERRSIVIGEQCIDKNELIDVKTRLERTTTFCDLEITNTHIYALYMNQDYDDAYEKSKPQDLLIFNLDGDIDRVVRLNEYIVDIDISSNGKYLYGITPNDEIYRYKIVL